MSESNGLRLDQLDPATTPTLRVEEAARLMGVSRSTAYRAVTSGAIPSIRLTQRTTVVPTAAFLRVMGLPVAGGDGK